MHRTVPAVVLAALLAFGGLAAASDGDGSSTTTSGDHSGTGDNGTAPPPPPPGNETTPPPPGGPAPNCDSQPAGAPRDRCLKERYCHDHPADPRCANRPANGTKSGKPGEKPEKQGTTDRLEHIEFTAAGLGQLTAFKVDGQLTLDALALATNGSRFTTERRGDSIMAGDDNTRLRIHDNPVGLIEFKGEDGSLTLTFPAGATITPGPEGHAARIHYADGRDGLLVADHAGWNGRNVTLTGFATFHVARADPFEDASGGAELRPELQAALEKRHLGAEVDLQDHPANASRAVQVVAYDDVAVQVQLPGAAAHGNAPISVRLSANLTAGRAIVLHVDPALVGNATPDRLELHYYDEHADGTRTEVVFAKADSLADVLDPTNDGGRPEYWVVQDADGLQVLVSVPHWSIHTVTLAGLAALAQPSVLVGIVAGSAGIAVAAVGLFWPRRRDL